RCCSLSGPGSGGNRRTSDSSGLAQRPLHARLPLRPVLSFHLAVSFRPRPRPPRGSRGRTYLPPPPLTPPPALPLSHPPPPPAPAPPGSTRAGRNSAPPPGLFTGPKPCDAIGGQRSDA